MNLFTFVATCSSRLKTYFINPLDIFVVFNSTYIYKIRVNTTPHIFSAFCAQCSVMLYPQKETVLLFNFKGSLVMFNLRFSCFTLII